MLNLEASSSPFELVQQEIMNEMTEGGPLGSHQESFPPLTAVWWFGIHCGLLALTKKKHNPIPCLYSQWFLSGWRKKVLTNKYIWLISSSLKNQYSVSSHQQLGANFRSQICRELPENRLENLTYYSNLYLYYCVTMPWKGRKKDLKKKKIAAEELTKFPPPCPVHDSLTFCSWFVEVTCSTGHFIYHCRWLK